MNQDAKFEVKVREKPGTVSRPFKIKVKPRFDVFIRPEAAETDIGGEMVFAIKFAPKPADYEGLVRMWVRGLPAGIKYAFDDNPIPMSHEGRLVIFAPEDGPVGEWTLSLACIEVPSIDPLQ